MSRVDPPLESTRALLSRIASFVHAEVAEVRRLLGKAATVGREDGPAAALGRVPGAARSLRSASRRNFAAVFGNASSHQGKWEGKDGWYSPEYYAMVGPNEMSNDVADAVEEWTDGDASVLEIGCSSGRHLSHLHDRGYEDLYGVEINEDAIDVMEKAFPEVAADVTVYERPVQEVIGEFEDDQFDVVYTVETLELIDPDDEWVFDEVRRVAGELLVVVENEGSDEGGPDITVIEDFPLFHRDWKSVFENDDWTLVETDRIGPDTLYVFR